MRDSRYNHQIRRVCIPVVDVSILVGLDSSIVGGDLLDRIVAFGKAVRGEVFAEFFASSRGGRVEDRGEGCSQVEGQG